MSSSDEWKSKTGPARLWAWIWDRPFLVFVAIMGAFYYWLIVEAPKSIAQKDDRRYYIECLQVVLARASIDVAETMCGHMRK